MPDGTLIGVVNDIWVLVCRSRNCIRVVTAGLCLGRSSTGNAAGAWGCVGRRSIAQRVRSGRAATRGSGWVAERSSPLPGPGSIVAVDLKTGEPGRDDAAPGSDIRSNATRDRPLLAMNGRNARPALVMPLPWSGLHRWV